MRLVIVESPYRAGTGAESARYKRYLDACLRDCLLVYGESPFASHKMYADDGVLRDSIPKERALGIAAGLAWGAGADATVVYMDLGISDGMAEGIKTAMNCGRLVKYRRLDAAWELAA